MNNPKISVVMPVFNEEEFLDKSLSSYFSQTIASECELIVVDDGSTDGSLEVIERHASAHPASQVKILRRQNEGSGKARNAAMAIAQGEYLAFLDADDAYPQTSTLEMLYRSASEHGVSVAGGSLIMFDGVREHTDYAHVPGFEGHQFLQSGLVNYEDYQFDYGYQRFIYKRSLLEENGIAFPPYLRYQDPPFFVRAMIAAQTFYACSEPTYWYRSSAKTVTWTNEKAKDMIAGMRDVAVAAAQGNFERLFALNLARMNEDWHPTFRRLIVDEQSEVVLRELLYARDEILKTQSDLDLSALLADSPSVLWDFIDVGSKLHEREEALAECDAQIAALAAENERLRAQADELSRKAHSYSERVEAMEASTAWKVGRAATYVPRAVKSRMLEKKQALES